MKSSRLTRSFWEPFSPQIISFDSKLFRNYKFLKTPRFSAERNLEAKPKEPGAILSHFLDMKQTKKLDTLCHDSPIMMGSKAQSNEVAKGFLAKPKNPFISLCSFSAFSASLKNRNKPRHFEESLLKKFGAKRHDLGRGTHNDFHDTITSRSAKV